MNVGFDRCSSRVQGYVAVDLGAAIIVFCVRGVGAANALYVMLLSKQTALFLLILNLEASFLIIKRFENLHRAA